MKSAIDLRTAAAGLGLLAVTAFSPSAAAQHAATAEEAAAIVREAVVWGYPLVVMDRTRRIHLNPPPGRGTPVAPNTFRHVDRLSDHTTRTVVMPNNDTLYSVAWLKLNDRPVMLSLPAAPDGRYVSFQLLDAWTNTVGYARPNRDGMAIYVIAGPNWRPEVPSGLIGGSPARGDLPASGILLRSPTNMAWLLGRTLVDDPADLSKPRALQAQFRLASLAGLPPTPEPPGRLESPQNPTSRGIGFLDELAALLPENPPPAADAPAIARLARIGLVPGGKPSAWLAERGWTDPAAAAIASAAAEIERAARGGIGGAGDEGGWRVSSVGVYGQDYALRARVARAGLGALTADEALYFTLTRMPGGAPLAGTTPMTLRLDPRTLPPIGAFWSLSLYGTDFFFVENPIGRFAIGDRTPGLVRDADGAITITISKTKPAAATANWLPAPDGAWMLTFRVYRPEGPAAAYQKALPLPEPVR